MSLPHAAPGECVDVRPLGESLHNSVTTTLVKTEGLEVIRLVLPAGKALPPHAAKGVITVQCLEGRITFATGERSVDLEAGQLLFLPAGVRHEVKSLEDASVLLTIRL